MINLLSKIEINKRHDYLKKIYQDEQNLQIRYQLRIYDPFE